MNRLLFHMIRLFFDLGYKIRLVIKFPVMLMLCRIVLKQIFVWQWNFSCTNFILFL